MVVYRSRVVNLIRLHKCDIWSFSSSKTNIISPRGDPSAIELLSKRLFDNISLGFGRLSAVVVG